MALSTVPQGIHGEGETGEGQLGFGCSLRAARAERVARRGAADARLGVGVDCRVSEITPPVLARFRVNSATMALAAIDGGKDESGMMVGSRAGQPTVSIQSEAQSTGLPTAGHS